MTALILSLALLQVPTVELPPLETTTRTISEYSDYFHGRRMANQEIYTRDDDTLCASNDWKLGTKLRLTNGEYVAVFIVKDKMHPRFKGKRIDLSPAGVEKIGGVSGGLTKNVTVEVVW